MNASGSDLPSYLGKSICWNYGGRSLWCSPEVDRRGSEEAAAGSSCPSLSTLACKDSTDADSVRRRAARSVVVGSAIGDVANDDGDEVAVAGGGGGTVGLSGGVVEERLDADTRCYEP